MPPVVKVHQPINEILSKDPALVGYDNTKYLFTDITFGVPNEHRLIVERDPDGTLQMSDHDTRKRLNQIYFPIQGRKVREPMMFADEEKLNSLLEAEKYEYILDRACIQYEPDEPSYQKVTSITYQHVDMKTNYKLLRSTRHFGPLAFYLTWHQSMDNLMLELLQTGVIREAVLLMGLRHAIHEDIAFASDLNALVQQAMIAYLKKSTRHFGPLAFYLTWHQSMDNLMLELLQTGVIREAVLLMGLRHAIHEDIAFASDLNALVQQVLPMPVQASKPDSLSEEDIQLDNKCIDCVVKYIAKNSAMKSQQELALQGFKEDYQQMVELSRGLRKAHGEA
ncbi:28S ribosomal protein S22, mitochondrial [Papilio machaon]|uniref:28S ribosomal protein S22, mitochondrial n=1 Tax=Papilio machaon TaxID=76193 RepID=A0A194RNE5_PAPMA|nr:28S ribosomal protein S22, mitochondrial [Papilio machaon]